MTVKSAKDQADAARSWWRDLRPLETKDGRKLPGDRATLARLRRCSSPLEAAAEPATAQLLRKLEMEPCFKNIGRVAVLAALLAHVRDEPEPSRRLAEAIGAPAGGKPEDALVKPIRFKHLVTARGDEEILIAFRRAILMLARVVNVRDLARLVLGWTDDEAGDRLRTRFAFDYHGAGFAAPDAGPSSDPATIEPEKV